MTTSFNRYAGNFGGIGNFGGLHTNHSGALAEETTDEIQHVEQDDTSERQRKQSFTIGDAIDITVQKGPTVSTSTSYKVKVMSTSKDK